MTLSLKIALFFFRGSQSNILVSLVSLIAVISITVGIIIFIVILSIMNGFQYELNKRILSIIPHGEIVPVNYFVWNWETILSKVRKIPHVIQAIPYLNFSGIIEYNNKWHAIYVRSIDVSQNINSELFSFIDSDVWNSFCKKNDQIIIGKGVSDVLNIEVGDWITICIHSTVDSNVNNAFSSFKKIRVQVLSILNLNSQLDNNLALVSLLNAQRYNNKITEIEGISIKIDDIFAINKIIVDIEKNINDKVHIYSWMDTYGYIYRDIQMIRAIVYLSILLIIGIASVSVIVTLILSIKDKNYDIAILRILGGKNVFIRNIFFWYGLIIYFVSSIMGVSIGICISFILNFLNLRFSDFVKNSVGLEKVYFIDFLPSNLRGLDIFIVLSIVFLLGILVSWCLSSKTKKINLSKILK